MKTNLIFLILVFLCNLGFSQDTNYLITTEGDKIELHYNIHKKTFRAYDYIFTDHVNFTPSEIYYYDEKGESNKIKQKTVKELHFDGRSYINLPIRASGTPRLHEVIAISNKYLLTQYFHTGYYFYIFDKRDLTALELKKHHSLKEKQDTYFLDNVLLKYFSDCPQLISQIKTNIKNSNYKKRYDPNNRALIIDNILLGGLNNFQCP